MLSGLENAQNNRKNKVYRLGFVLCPTKSALGGRHQRNTSSVLGTCAIQHSTSTTMQLQFIDSGGLDGIRKLEGRQRKLVRSYVMKGRNLNKTIRRGKCNQQEFALQSVKQPAPSFSEKQPPYHQIASIPGRIGDEFSGFQFAFELEPYMRRAMYNCEYSVLNFVYWSKIELLKLHT